MRGAASSKPWNAPRAATASPRDASGSTCPALPHARSRGCRNTVYAWAAHEILARRLAEERPSDPIEYAASVHHHAQALRYRAHDKLMRAFLDDEVFTGQVRVQPDTLRRHRQTSFLDAE
jgi:hypothetical protein